MAVQPEDIKLYRAKFVNNEDSNGGIMSNTLIVTGVKNNIFPDVPDSERVTGSTKYRKVFWKVENTNNDVLNDVKIYMTRPTNGNDYIVFFPGTQTDTQGDITNTPPSRVYGGGYLTSDISANATQLQVTIEDTSLSDIIQTGDTIWIGDGTKEEFHENVSVSVVDTTMTITLDSGDNILNDYTANSTIVSSCVLVSDIKVSYSDLTITSSAGTYDDTTYPILLDSTGTVEDTWTVTFSDATNFSVEGTITGSVGTGDINTDFSPDNPDFSGHPYFTINKDGWGGTWAANDTLTFKTHPASSAIWFKRVVPANCETVYDIFAHAITGNSV